MSRPLFLLEILTFIGLPVFRYERLVDQGALKQAVCFEPLPYSRARLSIVGKLDHFIKVEIRLTRAGPIEHSCAVEVIQGNIAGPPIDEFIVPLQPAILDHGWKVSRVRFTVRPTIIVGLVIGVARFWKSANQTRCVFINLIPRRIIEAIRSLPNAFVPREQGHDFFQFV